MKYKIKRKKKTGYIAYIDGKKYPKKRNEIYNTETKKEAKHEALSDYGNIKLVTHKPKEIKLKKIKYYEKPKKIKSSDHLYPSTSPSSYWSI